MTDCDLCGRGIPTVIPVRVIRPILKFAYPEGVWKGLCEPCLDSAQKTYLTVSKNPPVCKRGKCALCGDKTGVFPAKLQVPDFSKGVVKKDVDLCYRCLKAADEAYIRFKRTQIDEEGRIHGHEHVHPH